MSHDLWPEPDDSIPIWQIAAAILLIMWALFVIILFLAMEPSYVG